MFSQRIMTDNHLKMIPVDLLRLAANSTIADSAIVGCVPDRCIQDLSLFIGPDARIRSGGIIYAGSRIGCRLNVGHYAIIREENLIGDDFSIWSNSTLDYGCKVGNRVKIHHNVYVAQYTVLEDDVFLAPGVMIANDPHPGCSFSRQCMRGPVIKKGAQIGVNATILPFVVIGERALIGSGSVVTKDVPAGAVMYGNPARQHGDISKLRCIVEPKLTDKPYPDWESLNHE